MAIITHHETGATLDTATAAKKIDGLELLRKIQRLLVDYAIEKKFILENEFGTVEKWKQFVIAFTLKSLVDMGFTPAEAFDVVAGEGAHEHLVKQLWEAGTGKWESSKSNAAK